MKQETENGIRVLLYSRFIQKKYVFYYCHKTALYYYDYLKLPLVNMVATVIIFMILTLIVIITIVVIL